MNKDDLNLLAEKFVKEATATGQGDNLLIYLRGVTDEGRALAEACKSAAEQIGATARIEDRGSVYMNKLLKTTSPDGLIKLGQQELEMVSGMQTNINICDNFDESLITEDRAAYRKAMKPALDQRVGNTRWLVVNAPSKEFAAACGMAVEEMEDFYKKVCLLDYKRMAKAVIPLKEFMDQAEHVRITGPGTDLEFSIKGLMSQPCVGARNIPDGECYTAPVKESVNGTIAFGPSVYEGQKFSRLDLRYTDGYISLATAGNAFETAALNSILDRDGGARFVGEFAIAFNPHITRPVGDILFDEKMGGSIHMAQGAAYEGATDNGNRSVVHWDMVHSQRPEHGGGRLWVDGEIIRKDGEFILPQLEGLNPENLM